MSAAIKEAVSSLFHGAAQSAPERLPNYVYKILPNTSVYQGTPIPIPSDHEFPRTQSDLSDGFMHLSTRTQLPGTLSRFFSDDEYVQLLKVDYGRMSAFKKVQWDKASNGDYYPHLYGTLTGDLVVDLKLTARGNGWSESVEMLEEQGWLEG